MARKKDRIAAEILNSDPLRNFFTITPDTDNDLAIFTRAIWVGSTGDLVIDGIDSGTAVTIPNITVGWHPICARRVRATSTAGDLVGAY
jgi:hypothetical protein